MARIKHRRCCQQSQLASLPMFVDLDGGPIRVHDFGGDGPLLLLVHGLGGSLANWELIGPSLARDNHVVAMDLPGFGLSPPWVDWELSTHARVVQDLIAHYGQPASLVGNSMGGLLAQMVAAEKPESVKSLILISPAAPPVLPDPNINWRNARHLLLYSIPGVGVTVSKALLHTNSSRDLVHESLERITQGASRVPVETIETFVELADTRRQYPWAIEAVPKTGASIRRLFLKRSAWTQIVRGVECPTLVVQGVDDPIVSPTSVDRMCEMRPDWMLIRLEATGHTPQLDSPVQLLSVIRPWLADLERSEIGA